MIHRAIKRKSYYMHVLGSKRSYYSIQPCTAGAGSAIPAGGKSNKSRQGKYFLINAIGLLCDLMCTYLIL